MTDQTYRRINHMLRIKLLFLVMQLLGMHPTVHIMFFATARKRKTRAGRQLGITSDFSAIPALIAGAKVHEAGTAHLVLVTSRPISVTHSATEIRPRKRGSSNPPDTELFQEQSGAGQIVALDPKAAHKLATHTIDLASTVAQQERDR